MFKHLFRYYVSISHWGMIEVSQNTYYRMWSNFDTSEDREFYIDKGDY